MLTIPCYFVGKAAGDKNRFFVCEQRANGFVYTLLESVYTKLERNEHEVKFKDLLLFKPETNLQTKPRETLLERARSALYGRSKDDALPVDEHLSAHFAGDLDMGVIQVLVATKAFFEPGDVKMDDTVAHDTMDVDIVPRDPGSSSRIRASPSSEGVVTFRCAVFRGTSPNTALSVEIKPNQDFNLLYNDIQTKLDVPSVQLFKISLTYRQAMKAKPGEMTEAAISDSDSFRTVQDVLGTPQPERVNLLVVALPDSVRGLLEIYDMAWGKAWPRRNGIITRGDCGLHDGDNFATQWDYECLTGIETVTQRLQIRQNIENLVIREDFKYVADAMRTHYEEFNGKKSYKSYVVTGQPGIGKTTFLLYLLLDRLEKCLPTAFQADTAGYAVFDLTGVCFCDGAQGRQLSSKYWALCDSNHIVAQPCSALLRSEVVVVQATSPKKERWRGWTKDKPAKLIVMDLPPQLEIGAIVREAKLDPEQAIVLEQRWGPTTRIIMEILRDSSERTAHYEQRLAEAAKKAASLPTLVFGQGEISEIHSDASTLLFIRPIRSAAPPDHIAHGIEIPTRKLMQALKKACSFADIALARNLFVSFTPHSQTRVAAGWMLERLMHMRLTTPNGVLALTPDGQILASRRLAPGTVSALQTIPENDAFYWMPSAVNFPGIDSVAGDADHLYALQATIASEHTPPQDGLRKIWQYLPSWWRNKPWYYVIVADTIQTAEALFLKFETQGQIVIGQKVVHLRYCVLNVSPNLNRITS